MPSLRDRVAAAADLLLNAEPLWAVPALGFACTSLLWGQGKWWIGLVVASIPLWLRRWRKGYFSHRTPLDRPVALFLLASLVGLCCSPDRCISLRAFLSCLALVLLYYLLVNLPHPAYIKWGLAFVAVCVFAVGLLALRSGFTPPSGGGGLAAWAQEQVQHLPQVPRISQMANPTLSAAHGLAVALEMVFLPFAGLALFSRRMSVRIAAMLLVLPSLVLLLLLGSQGAWLAVSLGLGLLLVWRARWTALLLAAVLGLGYLAYRQGWIDPSSFLVQYGPAASLGARLELWKNAIHVIGDHPITGCGLGCLGKYSTTAYLSPHNAYLQFYADMGIVGLLAVLGTLVCGSAMIVDLVKASRDNPSYGLTAGILAAGVAVAVHGVFEGSPAGIIAESTNGYYYIVSPVVAILAGLFVGMQRFTREPSPGASRSVPLPPVP